MSILDEIERLCESGRLYSIPQSFQSPWYPPRRVIYGSGSLKTLLAGIGANEAERIRIGELWADLDYFLDGRRIDLRPLSSLDEYAHMALLDPASDEVWEIRSVAPRPAIRLFGAFVKQDVFVALTWALRKELRHRYSKEWRAAIQEFKEEWSIYFGRTRPISGSYPDAYLSNARIIQ
jgi:hypothetical protein